ncbi:MAG: hypothetical protein CM1200mP34_5780 [Verrucomicrobiales bacterium]|nr:MAG: hypothetical protein CM1200mP34_5780 [Verrucomicrobiales bacterium]
MRDLEVSIEVSETALRRYSLTFDEVARAVRLSSIDLQAARSRPIAGAKSCCEPRDRPSRRSISSRSRCGHARTARGCGLAK